MGMNIGFLIPWPTDSDQVAVWSMWATVATAVATIALAIFAVLAWRAALGTIRSQVNSDQIAALSEYISALNSMSKVVPYKLPLMMPGQYSPEQHQASLNAFRSQLDDLHQRMESTSVVWSAHHRSISGKMSAFTSANSFLLDSIEWWRGAASDVPKEDVETQHRLWSEFLNELSRYAAQWQVNKRQRKSIARSVTKDLQTYLRASPLRPSGLKDFADYLDTRDAQKISGV